MKITEYNRELRIITYEYFHNKSLSKIDDEICDVKCLDFITMFKNINLKYVYVRIIKHGLMLDFEIVRMAADLVLPIDSKHVELQNLKDHISKTINMLHKHSFYEAIKVFL